MTHASQTLYTLRPKDEFHPGTTVCRQPEGVIVVGRWSVYRWALMHSIPASHRVRLDESGRSWMVKHPYALRAVNIWASWFLPIGFSGIDDLAQHSTPDARFFLEQVRRVRDDAKAAQAEEDGDSGISLYVITMPPSSQRQEQRS